MHLRLFFLRKIRSQLDDNKRRIATDALLPSALKKSVFTTCGRNARVQSDNAMGILGLRDVTTATPQISEFWASISDSLG